MSLAQLQQSGWRPPESEVLRIARELLDILLYLASLRPPVVHRDIKPENVVLEGGKQGGRVFLVDFGGVQEPAGSSGSTVIGTYGYMAPEQFAGRATPASDLYAVGGTLLSLASDMVLMPRPYSSAGRAPITFPTDRMRVVFEDEVTVSPVLAALLRGLLEPVAEDRLTAQQALLVLDGKPPPAASRPGGKAAAGSIAGGWSSTDSDDEFSMQPAEHGRQEGLTPQRRYIRPGDEEWGRGSLPADTRVQVERSEGRLLLRILPRGVSSETVYEGGFAVTWNAFVGWWTVAALSSGGAAILPALFSIPFWVAGAQLVRSFMQGTFRKEELVLDAASGTYRLTHQLASIVNGKPLFNREPIVVKEGSLDGGRVQLVTVEVADGKPGWEVEVISDTGRATLGDTLTLDE